MGYYLRWAATVTGVVLFSLGLAWQQGAAVFPDPDVFYHMGMAEHLWQFGLAGQFSGLAPTTLGVHYTDQHFLLHALLAVFITMMTPVVGTKVFIVIALLSCLTTFGWMLRVLRLPGWWLGVIALGMTNPWLFRLSLVKATPLALILVWLAVIVLAKKRYRWLVPIGAVYVWTHGGFVLLPLIVAAWSLSAAIVSRKITWTIVLPFVYTVLGIALALVTHPAFPDNLYFYWEQLVQIGAINYQQYIGVGGEWYPYVPGNLLFGHAVLFVAAIVGCVLHIAMRRRLTTPQLFFLLVTIGMVVLTLKSKRYVEYLSPLLAATAVSFIGVLWQLPWLRWLHLPLRHQVTRLLAGCVVVMAVVPMVLSDYSGLVNDLHGGQATTYLQGVGQYLASLPPGTVVAPSDWDDFPALWYGAPNQQYLIGLDATFLYRADPNRYLAWKHITLGEAADPAADVATVAAQYYVVAKDHQPMFDQVTKVGGTVVYEDAEAWVLTI
ncbi:MAG: hypothetical protein HY565_02350 [Candidatus Kerfeldbacteria bacterium]|nr:hypothetical protein [Candidatus Kerfeldbacteria bacterium]